MAPHHHLMSCRPIEELPKLPAPTQHSVGPIGERDRPAGKSSFPGGDENVPLIQVEVFAMNAEDLSRPHARFHDDGRDILQKRIGVLHVDALFRKGHDSHIARPFGQELDMETADGVAHSCAPVSERSETSKVTVDSRRTALAGTDGFETFHGLSVHAFDSYRSEMSDQTFGRNPVSLVCSWFDVAICPRQEPVKRAIKS